MRRRFCDRCGIPIKKNQLRYVVKIRVYAAYDPLEIDFEDTPRENSAEIEQIVRHCEDITEQELMRDVYVEYQFNLCRPCQKAFVSNPLPPAKRNDLDGGRNSMRDQ